MDWLASGTYDRKVGLSAYTLQVTHRIAANTDQERDHVVSSLKTSGGVDKLTVIEHYSTGYHSRNGGGDSIQTDGALPIVDLKPRS